MKTQRPLLNVLHVLTTVGSGLLGLITAYLLIVAIIALFGGLPEKMYATFEVPLSLHNTTSFYSPQEINSDFTVTHIEVKRAELEVLPKNTTWWQMIGYLHAALYIMHFFLVIFLLQRIFKDLKARHTFSRSHILRIRWIGLITISIGIYQFMVRLVVTRVFSGKFVVANADVAAFPTLADFNFVAIFMGMTFILLSEVFKEGTELQELEQQTV
ncbi:MAG: DUF2975 domain-containing protein [Bacteroidota bacterium]